MTTLADVKSLIEADENAFYAVASVYELLLGGVPTAAGFEYLLVSVRDTNFGSNNPSIDFNAENSFINIANSLVGGNAEAALRFEELLDGETRLDAQVEALYQAIIPEGFRSEVGLAWLTRPEALEFYQEVADERGVDGEYGAAIVAFGSILNIAQVSDIDGIGDGVTDFRNAILDLTATLPLEGSAYTPMEDADGVNFDNDDQVPLVGAGPSLSVEFFA